MKRLFLMMLAPLALAACDPGERIGSVSSPIEQVQLTGLTGLTAAMNVYTGVANAAEVLVKAGAFNRDQLVALRDLNAKARLIIAGTDKALTYEQRIDQLKNISVSISSMLAGRTAKRSVGERQEAR